MQHTSNHLGRRAALPPALKRGEWPADPSTLPYFLTEDQLGHLLNRSLRTLERQRRNGTSVPFVTIGRQVLYPRDAALEHLISSAKRMPNAA